MSVAGDAPVFYTTTGTAVLFGPAAAPGLPDGYAASLTVSNSSFARFPPPYLFTGTLTIALLPTRQNNTTPACSPIAPNPFGETSQSYYVWSTGNSVNENCYAVGNVTFTAGVIRSERSTYISPTVVERQGEQLDFEPDIWVQNALWLLPDLMTMNAVMNSSSLPTWNNINDYAEMLIRYSYLGAWDSFHSYFDASNTVLTATSAVPRLQAHVSFLRVIPWLGISVLMTLSGVMLLLVQRRWPTDSSPDGSPPDSDATIGLMEESIQEGGSKTMLEQ